MSPLALLVGALVLVGAALAMRERAASQAVRRRIDQRRSPPKQQQRTTTTPRRDGADPTATYPDVVDLLAVAAASGLPAAPAVAAVASRAPPPWPDAFAACLARAEAGALFADALDAVIEHAGDVARPLVAVLRSGLDDGDRLAADLIRTAVDGRDLRRRRAEEQARRIPVRLLLPLVTCSLPAFAVLSIVPIVAGTLDGLRFPTLPAPPTSQETP